MTKRGKTAISALTALGLGMATLVALPATEARADQALAQCFIKNTTPSLEGKMRRMIVAALEEAPVAELQQATDEYGGAMVEMAITQCQLSINEFSSPRVQTAVAIYGQYLGEKIMKDAFARLGGAQ